LLWPHRNAVGNGAAEQMVHGFFIVLICCIRGEVTVAGIAHQIPGNAVSDGVGQFYAAINAAIALGQTLFRMDVPA
jgi:hypothetical protein